MACFDDRIYNMYYNMKYLYVLKVSFICGNNEEDIL